MKKTLFIKIILILSLVYLLIIYLWYLYPSNFFGIKYKNTGELKLKDLNKGPYLFVVEHEDDAFVDTMVMSQELHNHSNKNQKYNLITRDCNEKFLKLPYLSKYNTIKVKGKTVEKCIDKIKNKENIVIFLRKNIKNKGIYHILKETKIPIVLVKKKLIKNQVKESRPIIIRYINTQWEINYNLYDNYEIEKNEPEEFLNSLKDKLFN